MNFGSPQGAGQRAATSAADLGGSRSAADAAAPICLLSSIIDLLYTSTTAICDSFSSHTAPTHLKVPAGSTTPAATTGRACEY